jgi:hypothetical protein
MVPNKFIDVTSCRSAGSSVLALVCPWATTTASCIRDQDIDPTPRLEDARNHRLDRLVIVDIYVDPQGGAI